MSEDTVPEATDPLEVRVTSLEAWVDIEGNGHFSIKVDHGHFPEVIGGLLAEILIQCIPGFELRGMMRQEVVQRVMQGYAARFSRQPDQPIIQTLQ